MLAEIYGRFTEKTIGVAAHPGYYDSISGNTVEREVWAEYYAYRMTNNTEALVQFAMSFPNTAQMLDAMYEEIYKIVVNN